MKRTPKKLPPNWSITERGETNEGLAFIRGEKTLATDKVTLYVEPDQGDGGEDAGYWLCRQLDAHGRGCGGGHGYEARSFAEAAVWVDRMLLMEFPS